MFLSHPLSGMAPIKDLIIKSATSVWLALGAGHSEAVYHAALAIELNDAIEVSQLSSGRAVPITYKGRAVGRCELDLDFISETGDMVILELKAIKGLRDDDRLQLVRYKRLFPNITTVGFLINFGALGVDVERVETF